MALSSLRISECHHSTHLTNLTWMEDVAQGAVIKNHDLAEIRLDLSEIFDVSPVPEGAVLPVVSPHEVLALYLEPVDNRIGVFLYGCGEDDEIIPFTNLEA
jgi:hypothetical protein